MTAAPIDPEGGRTASSWDRAIRALPAVVDWPPPRPWVVVAAHPDDEALGVGGAMALSGRAGIDVHVVTVTDGEASHPTGSATTRSRHGRRRRAEAGHADQQLGVAPTRTWLAIPDGEVAAHGDEVERRLGEVLLPATTVAVVAADDGHPDHDATGRAVEAVSRQRPDLEVVRYAVWAYNADPDTTGRLAGARRLALPPAVRVRKAAALRAHRSQVRPTGRRAPVLPSSFLAHHLRRDEVMWW